MAREASDPGISGPASQIVMRGNPPMVPPRGPIPGIAPDEGPIMMPPMSKPMSGGPSAPGAGGPQAPSASMYIPGASTHEVVRMDPGANDQVIDYPVGTGSWQSRSHAGAVPPSDGPSSTPGASKPVNIPATPTTSTSSGAGANIQ
jgi:hypothetical protein